MHHIPTSAVLWWVAVLAMLGAAILAGRVDATLATLGLVLLCAACELIDSTLGMGYGSTLTPILLVAGTDPLLLVPTILVAELASGFTAAFFHHEAGNISLRRGSPHLRAVVILSLGSLVGVFAGVELAFAVDKRTLVVLISLIILAAGAYILARSTREPIYKPWKIVALGVVASFNKSMSGGGYGPLMTSGQILSGVPGRSAVGITSIAEGLTCLAGATLFLLKGQRLELSFLLPVLAGTLK